ncbi:hypothetical protein [Robinsoniella sp. KNHs210]|uniref:hypothetical protein n=1 Tax=Robinsoniella sp. KNHs210 TaxID=1469950 RepID=UPI0012DE5ACD|nr:hypothetical protein [Robinsoniella sp. KNHs210]
MGYSINAQRERKRGIRSYSLDDEKVEKLNQIGMLRGLRSMCLREQDNILAK